MVSADLRSACVDSIREVSAAVTDAVVYMDDGCLEAFQLLGLFKLLLDLGARAVCSLEKASALDFVTGWNSTEVEPAEKMVVFTSCFLSDSHRYILRCLRMHETVLRCTIFTSVSEIAHSACVDSPLGPDAFHEYESLLIQDYEELIVKHKMKEFGPLCDKEFEQSKESTHDLANSMKDEVWSEWPLYEDNMSFRLNAERRYLNEASSASCTVNRLVATANHFPMIICALSEKIFVLPARGAVSRACLSHNNKTSCFFGLPLAVSDIALEGDEVPPGAILTAHFLYHLAAKMDFNMEIFSLGSMSKLIGNILRDMSSVYDVGRNRKSVGLLLIDRTLDMITPSSHGDSLIDRILSSLQWKENTFPECMGVSYLSSQNASLHNGCLNTLDIKIPAEGILDNELAHLTDTTSAFAHGWNSVKSDISSVNTNSTNLFSFGMLSRHGVSSEGCTPNFDEILVKATKDGASLLERWLLEALGREDITVSMKSHPGLSAAADLLSMVKMLAANEMSLLRHRAIIQLALATEIALSDPHSSRWDAFVSAENRMKLSAADNSQSLAGQIFDIISKSIIARRCFWKNRADYPQGDLLSLKDALILTMLGYILAAESFPTSGSARLFSSEEEQSFKEAMCDAILENPESTMIKFLDGLQNELDAHFKDKQSDATLSQQPTASFDDNWGGWGDDDTNHDQPYSEAHLKFELCDRIDQFFKALNKISYLRSINSSCRGVISLNSNIISRNCGGKGFLSRLLTLALEDYDIPGLKHHASVVGRFFRSGFGRLGLGLGQVKPKLRDQSTLLVFVVGGISGCEIREIQEAVIDSGKQDRDLILGSTGFLTPENMFDILMGSSYFGH